MAVGLERRVRRRTPNDARNDMWTIEWDNDTGPNDGYYVEWWNVTDGTKTFRTESEKDAEWLAELLNKHAPSNAGNQRGA